MPHTSCRAPRTLSPTYRLSLGTLAAALLAIPLAATPASALPEIRITDRNRVPACVTPDRLMQFLSSRNQKLSPQFRDIASHYKRHGEALRLRWDYAFFQMILETNYLLFKNGTGQGDVNARQNNFAGIGTTGGGVPGDNFPDASTGVLAQMQHLVAYSGEHVATPVARRTREMQDDIIQRSKKLGRPMTFKDLTRRWAADRRYGASIESVASRFRSTYCMGRQGDEIAAAPAGKTALVAAKADASENSLSRRGRKARRGQQPATQPDVAAASPPSTETERPGAVLASRAIADSKTQDVTRSALSGPGPALLAPPVAAQRPKVCKVFTASYGGEKNVLIRVVAGSETHFTALQVLDGQEQMLASSFIKSHAPGGNVFAEFPSRRAALDKAFNLCPSADGKVQ